MDKLFVGGLIFILPAAILIFGVYRFWREEEKKSVIKSSLFTLLMVAFIVFLWIYVIGGLIRNL